MSAELPPSGNRALRPLPLEANINRRTAQARDYLTRGLDILGSGRPFCDSCPMALLCAATEAEMSAQSGIGLGAEMSPSKRQDAQRTMAAMGIHLLIDETSYCLDSIIAATDQEMLTEHAVMPTASDPLPQNSPSWLVDRVHTYTMEVALRLQRGERI